MQYLCKKIIFCRIHPHPPGGAILIFLSSLLFTSSGKKDHTVLLEAESFSPGGWVIDQQSIDMMGEVVGMAASICKEKNIFPRDVYNTCLEDLKNLMREGLPEKK